jgi:trigger factor
MTANQQNYGEGITTRIEAPEPWQRVIKVEITREHFEREYSGRLKKAVKSHTKPGFRKGRTPRAIVEKEVGPMLRADTIEALIPKAWMVSVMEHKLAPITDPALENMEFGDEGPITFDLKVEVRPEVELKEYEGFAIKKREAEVTDKEVDEVLERLRQSKATYETVEREAAADDQVTLDLVPEGEDGNPDPERRIEDQNLVLGSENNMPAFNEALQGAKAGDERAIEVVYPADHPNEALKGRSLTFHCTVKAVAEKKLPALDDELAASFEEGKTLADLQADIRENLTKETEKRIGQEMDAQVQAELVRRNDVPLPPSMVQRYLESGLEELHRRNKQTGRPDSEQEDQEYMESGRPHAEKALKAMLLMEAVQKKEEIKVTDEDVDDRIEELAAESGFDVDRYREFVKSGDEKDRMKYDILERRTYDLLLSRAQIETVPADTDVLAAEEE